VKSHCQPVPHNHISDLLWMATATLQASGVDVPRYEAKVILAHVLDLDLGKIDTEARHGVSPEDSRIFAHLVALRAKRVPLSYVLHNAQFMGLCFISDDRALSPRQETELLAEMVIDRLHENAPVEGIALDVGCGCGVLGLTLSKYFPNLHVIGCDISLAALELYLENAAMLGVADRVSVAGGDYLSWLSQNTAAQIDYLVSNPPYVRPDEYDQLQPEITNYEPRIALVSPTRDGLGAYWEIATRLDDFAALRLAAFEIGRDQAEVIEIMREARPDLHWEIHNDYAGYSRIIIGERRG